MLGRIGWVGRNEIRIRLDTYRTRNSNIRAKRRELPNLRCGIHFIASKGSVRMDGAIDATDVEESKLGFSW